VCGNGNIKVLYNYEPNNDALNALIRPGKKKNRSLVSYDSGLLLKISFMAKVQLPLRVDEKIKADLISLSTEENRSVNNYVETVLQNHIALEKQKRVGKNKKNTTADD